MSKMWPPCLLLIIVLFVSPAISEWISKDDECRGVPDGEKPEHRGNTSVIVDEVITAVSEYLRKTDQTWAKIPDQSSELSFIGLKGQIYMFEGKLSGFDRMKRFGDSDLQYLNKGTSGSAALRFDDMSFFYKMRTTLIGYTRTGNLTASLAGLSMRVSMSVNLESLCKTIDRVKIENLDSIKVHVDSGWFLDSVTTTITNTVIWIYKNKIVPVIEEKVALAMQKFLANFDLGDVLRPPHGGLVFSNQGETVLLSINDIPISVTRV